MAFSKKLFFSIVIIFLHTTVLAQDHNDIIESIIDIYFQEEIQGENDDYIYNLLEEIINKPIDINKANNTELERIPFLTKRDVEFILGFRDSLKSFKNSAELLQIRDVDINTLRFLKFFVDIDSSTSISFKINKSGFRSRIIAPVQTRKGFQNGKYLGDKYKYYNKFFMTANNNIELVFLEEKDSGEKRINDFISYSLQISDFSIFDRIILGNYNVFFGHGLASWQSFYRSSYSLNNYKVKTTSFIKKYTSSYETQFLHGLAAHLSFNKFNLLFSLSNNKMDGTIDSNSTITSFNYSGLHRTESELEKHDKITETNYCVILDYHPVDNLQLSFLSDYGKYNNNLPGTNYNWKILNSLFINYHSSIFNLSFELANYRGKYAAMLLAQTRLSKNVRLTNSLSFYSKDYRNIYTNSFYNSSSNSNSYNIFTGIKTFTKIGHLDLFMEFLHQPQGDRYVAFPKTTERFSLYFYSKQFSHQRINLKLTYSKSDDHEKGNNYYQSITNNKINARIEHILQKNKLIRFKTRLEFNEVRYSKNKDYGYLGFEDIRVMLTNNLRGYFRITYFNTDLYTSRIYMFENDVPGYMSVSPLFDRGLKWYVLINYSLINTIKLSLKFSSTNYHNKSEISSGLNKILSNTFTQLTFQMDIQL